MAAKKTPGRKALAPAEQVGPEYIGSTPVEDSHQIETLRQRELQMVEQFGDGLPWHPDHYEAAIRSELRRGCEAFLKAGSYLIVARECALHGEWQGILDRLGLGRDQASRMMEAARRVAALPNVATSQHLIASTKNQGKLIELLSLPEDQFAELAEHGKTGDLSLDDVEEMTVRELRAAVRDARADIAAKDERNQKLTEAVEKAKEAEAKAKRKWKAASPEVQLDTLLAELEAAAAHVRLAVAAGSEEAGLSGAVIAVMTHAEEHGINVAEQVGGILANLINDLRLVRDSDYVQAPVIADKPYVTWREEGGIA